MPFLEMLNFEKDIFKNIFIFLANNSKEKFLLDKNIFGKYIILEDITDEEIIDDTDNDFKDYGNIKKLLMMIYI